MAGIYETTTPEETEALAAQLAARLDIGDVVCVHRTGWRRVYDLPERVVPAEYLGLELSDEQCLARLAAVAARALGVVTEADLTDFHRLQRIVGVGQAKSDLIGKSEWKTDPDYATPPARLPRLRHIFDTIEEWTKTKTKFEVMDICNKVDIPVGPILSMKEIAEEPSLRATGTVVEVDHPKRGKYLTVGNPIKMSDSPTEVKRSPLIGEHTEEILRKELGFTADEIAAIKASGAITAPDKPKAEAA